MKAGVHYPGRSVCLPPATLVTRRGDGRTEVSRGHSRLTFDPTEGPNILAVAGGLRFADTEKQKMSRTTHADSGGRPRNGRDIPSVHQVSSTTATNARYAVNSLMEQVVEQSNMQRAWSRVKSNKGSPGVDGLTIGQTAVLLKEEWSRNKQELLAGGYQPQAVLRVEIPKPQGGTRKLGIPTVRDRLIQQAIHQVIQPLFEPTFSDSSFGFRPGRSTHQAIQQSQRYIRQGFRWVVDMDLEKFLGPSSYYTSFNDGWLKSVG